LATYQEDKDNILTNEMILVLNENMDRRIIDVYKIAFKKIYNLLFIIFGVIEITNECVKTDMKKMYYTVVILIVANNCVSFVGEVVKDFPNIFIRKTQKIKYDKKAASANIA